MRSKVAVYRSLASVSYVHIPFYIHRHWWLVLLGSNWKHIATEAKSTLEDCTSRLNKGQRFWL